MNPGGLILAIDTSIGTSVALVGEDGVAAAQWSRDDPRGHAEAIGAGIVDVLRGAGIGSDGVTAVVVGMGPGAYTGLRVGIAAARAFAFGRGIPLWPVPSHDAIREDLGLPEAQAVATPAGRRGHYVSVDGATTLTHEEISGPAGPLRIDEVAAAALVPVALRRLAAGEPTGPDQPLYLREPDIAPPSKKRVS